MMVKRVAAQAAIPRQTDAASYLASAPLDHVRGAMFREVPSTTLLTHQSGRVNFE